MVKNLCILAALAIVLIAPLAWRTKSPGAEKAELTLVIVTPHNEAIRFEFARAFDDYYFHKNRRHVRIDWRTPGGTSEISRYLESQYLASFQNYWVNGLRRSWDATVQSGFSNPKAPLDDSPAGEARKAFLDSNVGCGIDLFFGGGSFDFALQASAGRLVDSGVIAKHPEIFNYRVVPQSLGGEQYWDPKGRWVGACLASFGICYNTDLLRVLKIDRIPTQWSSLVDPRYFGQIALGNPTQSGSVAKAFEMLIQQQMNFGAVSIRGSLQAPAVFSPEELRKDVETNQVPQGWTRAMQLIQKISANARYFTDSGTRVPFDVEAGDAAAGMCIDFYGRFESEAARNPDGTSRMQYVTPAGGSSVGADPIGMFRGAPNPELAREFMEFVISIEGQKLWNWKVGAPGGPVKYALRRLSIRPELYDPVFTPERSDPEVQPFKQAGAFVYHEQWTSPQFRAIAFIIRAMCIDPHDELRDAWQALIAAHFPKEATSAFMDVSKVDYAAASGPISDTLRSHRKIDELRLAKNLSEMFRAQYRRSAVLAREGK